MDCSHLLTNFWYLLYVIAMSMNSYYIALSSVILTQENIQLVSK